ncbi:ATP-binding cassette domain-containing protein [Anaerocolumna aminovalerica]|uniref:Oligopeptide transport system ATP-binding protein n=1 Tax=Anaerocolumna aminovalerica TaxID=1527 RepID=A0A1I5H8T6_9FIRM|nr:oligopeptide/dipeptide ABC transporter ATP-binding protein [Anaerocolumna aminovalerica]MDU6265145.1 ATP-binding cassette domain-containing protein [Anaerocolumna aminovalerica]SFO44589.1 oligopeptide transport system ATP-binding protein [Anaerocolumna aminovalerica]
MNSREPLVKVEHLKKYFNMRKKGVLKAVDDVSFEIYPGETVGLVGESGCGKTTCGRTILGLYPATEGKIEFQGKDISQLKDKKEIIEFKKNVQMIFQDPYASLNPRMTVGDIIAEGMINHHVPGGNDRIQELLAMVGLNKEYTNRFPHEFSGGQRQRIGIARALAVDPKFIVCDEPISALDVSIQAQVVNLLVRLQEQLGLTYLFIAHDLSMVKHISDHVGVMYMGQLVEFSSSNELYKHPAHFYTKALLSAIPIPDPKLEKTKTVLPLEGEVGSPINCGPGCRFMSRCKYATEQCGIATPELKEIGKGHFVACHVLENA